MHKCYKVKTKTTFWGLAALMCLFITLQNTAKGKNRKQFFKLLTDQQDTTKAQKKKDSSAFAKDTALKIKRDTGFRALDTTLVGDSLKPKVDTINISKDSLDAPVNYTAEDSGVLIIPTKQFILYGKATTDYKDMKLEANTISFDQQTNVILAYGGSDTSHDPLNLPKMTQAGSSSISDTIRFNMKTQRGLVKNTYYQEGEMFVQAKVLKKVSKDVAYGYRTLFTTCNLDTPHFAFRTRKVKIINNRFAVSGPAFPEFEGVPLPVGIPFGIYPLYRGRHSGFLPPQFTASDDFGLGLEGLGYYKVFNDYLDLTLRSNIYTYGGWSLNINPKYYKRYKYTGALTLAIQRTKLLNKYGTTTDEFTTNQSFNITWSHSMDNRARPGTSFSASVNAGSTKYNTYVTNNAMRNFQNQLSSSITYGKTWNDGKYILTMSANHNQNNNLGLVNLNVPTVNFTANTFYPFQKKEQVGTPKWYEKLGIQYTGTLLSQISFYDSAVSLRKLLDTAQWGAEHNIPISLTLPALGPIMLSPSISYSERWYGQKIITQWNAPWGKQDTLSTRYDRGFFRAQEVSFGLSANTRVFGTYNFGSTKLRHEIKPFISANYKPDLVKQFYDSVQTDNTGKNWRRISQFQNGVVGSYSEGRFGGFNFGFDNLFEMKVRDKKDTTGENGGYKKVRLIDGLGITGGYNFFADSLKWSPVSISFRSTLFDKVNITGSTSLDPYSTDTLGNRINNLLWKRGSLGRITGGNIAMSTSLKSKSKDGKTDSERIPQDETLTPDEQQRQLDYVRQNPAEFVDFDIPWDVQISYALSFSRLLTSDLRKYVTQINSNVSINGNFSLTEKWKIGGNTYFDFKTRKIQTLSMFITREMHCWQMAINITPIGPYQSFNFTINPKSGILRDLKINRSRFYYNQ